MNVRQNICNLYLLHSISESQGLQAPLFMYSGFKVALFKTKRCGLHGGRHPNIANIC